MHIARRPLRRAHVAFACIFLFFSVLPALGQKPRIQAQDYQINAEIVPKTHHLTAQAKVKFVALEDTNFASFELHNDLRVTKILDGNGKPLSPERITQDNAVRVTFPNGLTKGATETLTFDYEGALANADDSPVQGLKLAYIGEDVTYLLYPGRWFPVINYGIDRFTATINITAPTGTVIIGSDVNGRGEAINPVIDDREPAPGVKQISNIFTDVRQFEALHRTVIRIGQCAFVIKR